MIQQWEREWQNQVQLLEEKREELSQQLVEFQQNVERLKEGQRLVEKEREELCVQHKLLRHWKHVRQNSLPILFPHQKTEVLIREARLALIVITLLTAKICPLLAGITTVAILKQAVPWNSRVPLEVAGGSLS